MLRWQKFLCPVDFSEVSTGALRLAASLARRFEGEVLVVHVVEPIVAPADFTLGPMTTGEVEDKLVDRSMSAVRDLAATIDMPQGKVNVRVERGRASTEIIRVAQEVKADVIIMGTHGYTGVAHVLLGSTAERVIRKAPCPVLTVRATEAPPAKG